MYRQHWLLFFFFNDTATTEIYTLSLHDALPIFRRECAECDLRRRREPWHPGFTHEGLRCYDGGWFRRDCGSRTLDRKSTRLNSSHANISYAVFCLKKKIDFVSTPSTTTISSEL